MLGALAKVTAPGGVEREWLYAAAAYPAQLTKEAHPESGSVEYTYDAAGRLKTKQDARQTLFQYRYDDNGRLSSITAGQRVTTFTYEAGTDNRETATVDFVVTTTKYDAAGRVRSRTDEVPEFAPIRQSFEYDGSDNLTTVTYASGRQITYTYDSSTNQVTAVTDTTNVPPTVFADRFEYHASGAIASYHTPGVTHTVTFDHRYRPRRILADGLDLQYDYDDVGNVKRIEDARPGMNQVFHYDPLDRLTGMDASAVYPAVSYDYDAHGNRRTNAASHYGYDPQGHLRAQNGATFDYDPNGNLESSTDQGATYTYTLDNQLDTSTVAGVGASYRYDADGWRIAKASGLTSLYARGVTGQLFTELRPKFTRDYVYVGSKLLGVIKNEEPGATPEVRLVAGSRDEAGVSHFTFTADAAGSTALARADLTRAAQTGTCTVANDAACAWSVVDTQSAPPNTFSWTDGTSLTDAATPGAYVYTVQVTDANGAADTGAIVAIDSTDSAPDAFAFTPQSDVPVDTVVSSDVVHVTGLAGTIAVSVTGGAYRVCPDAVCAANPAFLNTASTITNGAYLQLRTTSSASVNVPVTATVTVGSGAATWVVTTSAQDPTPDPFGFTNQTGVTSSTPVTSNIVQITGIAGTNSVSVTGGGAYRVCTDAACGTNPTFLTAATTIANNAYLQVRLTSSASPSTAVSTTASVGSGSATWTVTTAAAQDVTPTAFVFTDQTGVPVSAVASSNVLQITGISGSVPVSITGGGSYRVCADSACAANPAFSAVAGAITNGAYLQLRLTASAAFATVAGTTVTVGTVADGWAVTTAAQDITPNAFAFVNQTGIALSTVVSSSAVPVTGITGAVAVSISGGNVAKFRVCPTAACTGVSFGTANTTITDGQYLGLQQTSSTSTGTTVVETVTVGNFSVGWSVTTMADACAGSPSPGTTCADGTKFVGYAPSTGTKMYTTPADYSSSQQFAWPQTLWGGTNNVNGLANTNGLAARGNYHAANACYYLTANGKSDWYLPAPREWNVMDPQRNVIGGFKPDDTTYWTSAEEEGPDWFAGIYHKIGSTFNGYTGMGIARPIRCVRRD